MNKLKSILLSTAISVFSLLVTLFIIEGGFRIATHGGANKQKWSDRPKEYYIHESSPTFQDYPHAATKPANTFRIAVIGDSFTFAPYMQFDDAFPKKLETYLNLNAGTQKVEVINYGVPAYSTNHEIPVVKKAIEEGADFILMQITFNDPELKPYTPHELFNDKNKFGELEIKSPLLKHWKSLAFVLSRLHNNITYTEYKKKFFDLFENPKTWNNFSGSWKTIVDTANAKQVKIAAVVFPLFGLPSDDSYPFHPIHAKVRELMNSLGVPSLDLYKTYEGIPLERLQVIVGEDFHPNEIAHRMAAEDTLRWLRDEKMLPEAIIPKRGYVKRIGTRFP